VCVACQKQRVKFAKQMRCFWMFRLNAWLCLPATQISWSPQTDLNMLLLELSQKAAEPTSEQNHMQNDYRVTLPRNLNGKNTNKATLAAKFQISLSPRAF